MKKTISIIIWVIAVVSAFTVGCTRVASSSNDFSGQTTGYDSLRNELEKIAASVDGRVGIALIAPEGDTLTVNNDDEYQLMSVFKLHEALAVAHVLDCRGIAFDTIVSIRRTELSPDTWSPMYEEHTEENIEISVRELLRYILQQSDNNASNYLFDEFVSVADCDKFIRSATGIGDFKLTYTEGEMQRNHVLADGNHSSPLACARLMDKVFSDSIVSAEKQRELQQILSDCHTGTDRIYVPLEGEQGVTLAHKTGSGYRTAEGILMAHNDVGRVALSDGRSYILAVLVKDFNGDESEASKVIARISGIVYNSFK
ncbi:MAG: class A beta-lactamase [Bacteroides sp.]|nr:class A beta-lactamase [Roseburia sp.]MCM1347263.1 class A beta-lactamase [Bacteroides sp.]MCM1421687.1 class A beta-lactamase [Bacteroides sp.]